MQDEQLRRKLNAKKWKKKIIHIPKKIPHFSFLFAARQLQLVFFFTANYFHLKVRK